MSTKDQTLAAALHGEALLTARRPELQPLIDHLREISQGRDDLRNRGRRRDRRLAGSPVVAGEVKT